MFVVIISQERSVRTVVTLNSPKFKTVKLVIIHHRLTRLNVKGLIIVPTGRSEYKIIGSPLDKCRKIKR